MRQTTRKLCCIPCAGYQEVDSAAWGFMVNVGAGLVAYSFRPKKPSLGLRRNPILPLLVG